MGGKLKDGKDVEGAGTPRPAVSRERIIGELQKAHKPEGTLIGTGRAHDTPIALAVAQYGIKIGPGGENGKVQICIQHHEGIAEAECQAGMEISLVLGSWKVSIKVHRNDSGIPILEMETEPE